jgi:hypothetical protein
LLDFGLIMNIPADQAFPVRILDFTPFWYLTDNGLMGYGEPTREDGTFETAMSEARS